MTGMRMNGPFEMPIAASVKSSAVTARPVEKPSPASLLQRQPQDTASRRPQVPPHLVVELVSQDETARFDPMWDGPRLIPAFVAQLMGQIMPERRSAVPLETAYGSARDARMALLLDRKS
jgi:hypothetical protein